MKLGDIGKRLHDTLMDDDDKSAPPAPRVPVNVLVSNPGLPTLTQFPFSVPSTTILDEAVYKKVLDKTNFDVTPVGKIVHQYFDSLEGVITDVNTRFKAAIKQAEKVAGITQVQILGAFDDMSSGLEAENNKFYAAADAREKTNVVGRQTQLQQISDSIAKLTQQINDLQAQHSKVSAELIDEQKAIANGKDQMQLAVTKRNQEIQLQKAQFTSLMQ